METAAAGARALFSVRVYVDRLRLSGAAAAGAGDARLVGFQLLQLEVVLFDRRNEGDGPLLALEHGKACLFEAEAATLAAQLRVEASAPLVILLMAQERDRARLVAFAGVPLALHVGLLAKEGGVPAEMAARVCEWATCAGEWELRDRLGEGVGHVSGAVTLSCLGKTLAPHLAGALGVHVGLAPTESPTDRVPRSPTSSSRDDSVLKQQRGRNEYEKGGDKACGSKEEHVPASVADAGVQCEEVADPRRDPEGRQESPKGIRLNGAGQPKRSSMRTPSRRPAAGANGDRYTTLDRLGSPRPELSSGRQSMSVASTSARGLPPPLFFHKQPARRER